MSTTKAKLRPKARPANPTSPRTGATIAQVEERSSQIRFDLFELQSLLKVCADALRLENITASDADDVGCVLKIGFASLDTLAEKLEQITWSDAEIASCEASKVARSERGAR